MKYKKKTPTLLEVQFAAKVAFEKKQNYVRSLYREGQYAWNELRPYEHLKMLADKVTEGEYHDIITRPEGAKPLAGYVQLTSEQMKAMNDLKAALDECKRLGIAGYEQRQ